MAAEVTIPTLLIHAWQDEWIRPNGAIRLFKLLKSTHKRLVLQNGPHRLSLYQVNQREQLRWLDRWVKGTRNRVDAEPPVSVFWEMTEPQDTQRAAPSWITTYSTWPPHNLRWSTLYLTTAGELTEAKPDENEVGSTRSYVYPLGTELVGSNEQFALLPHEAGELSYRTPPMATDTVILGAPQLVLFFSSDQIDTDFLFTLKDIDPSGNTLFLQRSVLRASLRAVDVELSTPDELVQSFAAPETLVPGKVYKLELSLTAIGHVVREGHRLELSVLAPNPIPNPVWGFAPVAPPSLNRIHHDHLSPSRLRLPIMMGEKAQGPTPALGTLKNQPFRKPKVT